MKPYYQQDGITIYHGDCREVLPSLDTVDHIITDPPFESEAHTQQRRVLGGRVVALEPLPFAPMSEGTRDNVASHIGRLARRWALIFCQIEAAMIWRAALESAGLTYRRTCIWVKPDGMPQYSGDRPGMGYETIVAAHASGRSRWNGGGRHGVWTINKNDNGGALNPHPTTKPGPLMRTLVSQFSDPGDLILDPFLGSGTTVRAAKDCGRRAIGIEIEERYCEIAARRLDQCVLDLS